MCVPATRKVRENQRMVAAQQARSKRLAGKNKAKYNAGNIEVKKQETRIKVKKLKAPKQIEEEKKIKYAKLDAFWKKYKLYIIVLIVARGLNNS